ncbi:MAG TPA: nucleotidyltransferase substrate binding protein [Chthoniobacterales bacterium]|jgi:nucleotidyltransferase substrate binding protein (TIGR01987 family)
MKKGMSNPDVRWRQRLQSFRKAFGQLDKAVDLAEERELTDLEQQGLIQAFEFTHELAWNVMKDFLESRGTGGIYGSKDATREAFAKGLIEDGEVWMEMIQSRNRTSHTYNEETAHQITDAIVASYRGEFADFLVTFTELEKEEA